MRNKVLAYGQSNCACLGRVEAYDCGLLTRAPGGAQRRSGRGEARRGRGGTGKVLPVERYIEWKILAATGWNIQSSNSTNLLCMRFSVRLIAAVRCMFPGEPKSTEAVVAKPVEIRHRPVATQLVHHLKCPEQIFG